MVVRGPTLTPFDMGAHSSVIVGNPWSAPTPYRTPLKPRRTSKLHYFCKRQPNVIVFYSLSTTCYGPAYSMLLSDCSPPHLPFWRRIFVSGIISSLYGGILSDHWTNLVAFLKADVRNHRDFTPRFRSPVTTDHGSPHPLSRNSGEVYPALLLCTRTSQAWLPFTGTDLDEVRQWCRPLAKLSPRASTPRSKDQDRSKVAGRLLLWGDCSFMVNVDEFHPSSTLEYLRWFAAACSNTRYHEGHSLVSHLCPSTLHPAADRTGT